MSSQRFPGKVLAPFSGRPLIDWVVDAVQEAVQASVPVIVLTSTDVSDDPLAAYQVSRARPFCRGPLDDVLERFRLGVLQWPCDWVLRVNADSPLLSPEVVRRVLDPAQRGEGCDLVSTVYPRTFPKGQNAELIRATLFDAFPAGELTAHDREHVTAFFYRNPGRYRIRNIASSNAALAAYDYAVDTLDDLRRLEHIGQHEVHERMRQAAAV